MIDRRLHPLVDFAVQALQVSDIHDYLFVISGCGEVGIWGFEVSQVLRSSTPQILKSSNLFKP
jgi:hypothetical protein